MIRSKLAKARKMFLEENIEKSGKNFHLEFKYFELSDIVPSATKIFEELGIVTMTEFGVDGMASMTVMDTEDMEEQPIVFRCPYREIEPIVSNTGKVVTNCMQTLGMSITYLRRYLYMMVLDIVEHDEIEPGIGKDEASKEEATEKPKKKASKPKTAAERKEIKEELVNADPSATEEQVTALKTSLKELLALDPSQNDFVQNIAMKTDGFVNITGKVCEELTKNVKEMCKAYGIE